jgi:hypothetical protein
MSSMSYMFSQGYLNRFLDIVFVLFVYECMFIYVTFPNEIEFGFMHKLREASILTAKFSKVSFSDLQGKGIDSQFRFSNSFLAVLTKSTLWSSNHFASWSMV